LTKAAIFSSIKMGDALHIYLFFSSREREITVNIPEMTEILDGALAVLVIFSPFNQIKY